MKIELNEQEAEILTYLLQQRVADLKLMIRHAHQHTCKTELKQQKEITQELLQRMETEK